MTTNTSPTDRAQEAASTAADEGRQVAEVAKEEVQNVASTTVEQARNLIDETRQQVTDQLSEQATTQLDRVAGTLRTFGDDLEQMAGQGQGSGLAVDAAREVAQRARALGGHLDGREPGRLLDDVRSYARRRPGTFLLGALAAGVLAGRLVRATTDGSDAATPAPEQAGAPSGLEDPADVVPPSAELPVSSGPAGVVPSDRPEELHPPMPSATAGQKTTEAP